VCFWSQVGFSMYPGNNNHCALPADSHLANDHIHTCRPYAFLMQATYTYIVTKSHKLPRLSNSDLSQTTLNNTPVLKIDLYCYELIIIFNTIIIGTAIEQRKLSIYTHYISVAY